MARRIRLPLVDWSRWKVSARDRRRARRAVSPEVMGRTMTPIRAMTPPTGPRMSLQTTPMVPVAREALGSCRARLYTPIAPAAHTIAMKPSRIIML